MSKTTEPEQSIQSLGGKARAAKMTPEERSDLARTASLARWDNQEGVPLKVLRATHMGVLKIAGHEIPCAVLSDGRRVLTQEGFLAAMGRSKKGKGSAAATSDGLPPFLPAKNLKPFISEELLRSTAPVKFRLIRDGIAGAVAYGYPAELLAKVCGVYLEARKAGALTAQQAHIADACEALVMGFAIVGIVALVDEATGYQRDRDRDELHRILEAYISKELLPWAKRFPDEFYKEMYRLRGWSYPSVGGKRTPLVGVLTNKLVYERLPPGVLEELQSKNPVDPGTGRRKKRHHQFLTEAIGHPHLDRHILQVTALMRGSLDWNMFKGIFARSFPVKGQQLALQFEEPDGD